MSRTNVDIDDDACAQVMRMYNLDSKREAINLALRKLAVVPMTKSEAMAMEEIFWPVMYSMALSTTEPA